MDKQEIFDKVAAHLLKQNARSIKGWPSGSPPYCRYRGDNGLMCAVGCLIPDDRYHPDFEGLRITHAAVQKAAGIEDWETVDMLDDLQIMHDSDQPHTWPDKLAAIAACHNVEYRP